MRERHGHLLGRREAVFAVQNHGVRAIQHHHRGAGALILALVHVQIVVLQVERQADAFARDRRAERRGGIQVQRVAELVRLRSAAGFDAGGPMARVVAAKARFAQRAEQIAQRLEAQKVQALVGHFEARLTFGHAGLAARPICVIWILRVRCGGDVVLLLHALDELVDQLVELAFCGHLVDAAAASRHRKNRPLPEPARSASRRSSSVCSHRALRSAIRIVKAGVEQIVRQRLQQVFQLISEARSPLYLV